MNEIIGNAAGTVWEFLQDQDKPVTLSALKKNLPLNSTTLMMALGWLSREDKLSFEMSDDSYSYSISIRR